LLQPFVRLSVAQVSRLDRLCREDIAGRSGIYGTHRDRGMIRNFGRESAGLALAGSCPCSTEAGIRSRIVERRSPMNTQARKTTTEGSGHLRGSLAAPQFPEPPPAHADQAEGVSIAPGVLQLLRGESVGDVQRDVGATAVTLSGYLRAASPQRAHEILEPIVGRDSGPLGMSELQRLEALIVLLRACSFLRHLGCFSRWGGELEALSLKQLGTAPEEAVSGLRLTMSWKDSIGEYYRARILGDGVPAATLSRCSVATRAGLAFARTGLAIRLGDLDTAETLGTQVVVLRTRVVTRVCAGTPGCAWLRSSSTEADSRRL
jgi:hypothetical protein